MLASQGSIIDVIGPLIELRLVHTNLVVSSGLPCPCGQVGDFNRLVESHLSAVTSWEHSEHEWNLDGADA